MAPTVEKLIDYNRAMYAGIIGSKLTEMLWSSLVAFNKT